MAVYTYQLPDSGTDSKRVSFSISAQNTFSDWLKPNPDRGMGVYITSTGAGTTITIQMSTATAEDGSSPVDVLELTAADIPWSKIIVPTHDKAIYRVGVKTGDYSAGPVVGELQTPSKSGKGGY